MDRYEVLKPETCDIDVKQWESFAMVESLLDKEQSCVLVTHDDAWASNYSIKNNEN